MILGCNITQSIASSRLNVLEDGELDPGIRPFLGLSAEDTVGIAM